MEAQASSKTMYCTNHPQTETLLRCNKCGRPMCLKCVERTVVGYRCKECLGQQRVGYYNATTADYLVALVIGLVLSILVGFGASLIGGFWLFAIFLGPAAGGIVSEAVRRAIGRRRGRYIWLVVCGTLVVGGLIGLGNLGWLAIPVALLTGQSQSVGRILAGHFFNIGFWILLVLAVSTAYARLRV